MLVTYKLDVNELTVDVIDSIKAAFTNKTITMRVSEAMDETEYLLSSQANRESLEQSIKQLEEGKGITFTSEEFQKKYGPAEG